MPPMRLLVLLGACSLGHALRAEEEIRACAGLTYVHLTDMQLGLKEQYSLDATNWQAEEQMLAGLVRAAEGASLDGVFVGGDMQNTWPNEKDENGNRIVGRNRMTKFEKDKPPQPDPEHPQQTDEFLKSGELGEMQRQSVKSVLGAFGNTDLFFTPGNHDIGDKPDAGTLELYKKTWGPLYQTWSREGILFLQINSQVYWNSEDPAAQTAKDAQNAFLNETLLHAQESIKEAPFTRVVILTHIPPFMERHDEPAGWANWAKDDRTHVLELLAEHLGKFGSDQVKLLWVCGHFHTNVENIGYVYESENGHGKLEMDIVVTSSSGTTMWWTGDEGKGSLDPSGAATVAAKPVGKAFFEDILGAGGIDKLMQPIPDRSGLRIFSFFPDCTYRSEWKTLKEAQEKPLTSEGTR